MQNKKVNIVFNIISKKRDEDVEELKDELIKHHRRINYHLKKIDIELGMIDDVINGIDGDFEDNWLD